VPESPRTPAAGQRASGDRTPLNANESFKAVEDPLAVRERIERIYAVEGFDSIPADDLRGRFRWWGLYTQRKPGIDSGRTATLEPEELDDRHFMLRVRCDGGALDVAQLRTIAGISSEFGRETADITDRQNIQLHWIRVEDVPEIFRRLEAVGLQTTEACGDCPRVILGSPLPVEDYGARRRTGGVLPDRPAGREHRGSRHRARPPPDRTRAARPARGDLTAVEVRLSRASRASDARGGTRPASESVVSQRPVRRRFAW